MSHRASIFERAQIGVEVTPGTAVAANNRLLSLSLDVTPITPTQEVKAQGYKAPVDQVVEKDFAEASFKGTLAFNDILYLLSSGLCVASIDSATNTWTFSPVVSGPDTLQTLTIEKGSEAGADRFAYGSVTDLDFEFGLKGADYKGKMIGTSLVKGVTMTASPVDVPLQVVAPKLMDVLVGDSLGSLVNVDAFKASWGFKGRQKGVMTLRSSQPSYSYNIEEEYGMSAQFVVEEDDVIAVGMMNDLLSSNKKYCQILAQGTVIGGGPAQYGIAITFPFKFKGDKPGDEGGVYAGTFDLTPIYDSSFGGVVQIVVTTDYVAL